MKTWPTATLGELLLTLETGSRPKGGVGEIVDGIPSVSGEHINRKGEFYWDSPKHITQDFYAGMKRGRIQRGDILVVKDGATTGKTAMVRDNFPFKEAAINEHVFLLRTERTKVLPEYAGYFLFSPVGQQQILSSFRGAAIGGIPQDFVNKVYIPLAPLIEQERIVKLLDEADELRKLRARADKRTATLLSALFHKMFGEPVANPKNWPVKSIGEITFVETGRTPSRSLSSNFDGSIPWVKTTEVNRIVITDTEEKLTEQGFRSVNGKLFPRDSIILAMYGQGKTRGQSAKLGLEAFCNQACAVLLPSEQVETDFLFSYLQISYGRLRALARGGNQENLNLDIVRSFGVPLPPLAMQKEFALRTEEIRELEANQATSRTRLDALFQSMLHRAFNGEL